MSRGGAEAALPPQPTSSSAARQAHRNTDGGALQWFTTCGDPVCRGHMPREDVERCADQQVGAACAEPPRMVASPSHRTAETDAFIARFGNCETVAVGSSLKFCLLAEGTADIYPRFGRTMEWDTAAGDAVLRAAGGVTLCTDGAPFLYGKRNQSGDSDFANPHFIAVSGQARARLILP